MIDNDDRRPPEEGSAFFAAEYVLGVLSADERREVEERLLYEPALARNIVDWEERLGALADEVKPVAPPTAAWSRIEVALDGPAPQAARPAAARAPAPALDRIGIGAGEPVAERRVLAHIFARLGCAGSLEHRSIDLCADSPAAARAHGVVTGCVVSTR